MKEIKIPPIFKKIGETIEPYFLSFNIDIQQSRLDTTLTKFLAGISYQAINMGLMFTIMLIIIGGFSKSMEIIGMALLIGPVITIFIFYSLLYQLRMKLQKKAKLIDKNLPFALRHLLIELKAGIPLYQAIVAISSDYKEMSQEVREIIKDINAGKSEMSAIEKSINLSPSMTYG